MGHCTCLYICLLPYGKNDSVFDETMETVYGVQAKKVDVIAFPVHAGPDCAACMNRGGYGNSLTRHKEKMSRLQCDPQRC